MRVKTFYFPSFFSAKEWIFSIVIDDMHVNEERVDLENCANCDCVMDVSAQPPFGHVACPGCGEEVHVKCDIGGYRILSKHGEGGMSLVFAAEDKTLGRKAAIKLLNENYSNDEKRIAEFEKEAKITASISHPNVVRVFTVGKAFDRYFIAMELIDGKSLEQQMHREGALDEKRVTRLAIEAVEGLKSAHSAGLIHRDIKPGNILIDAQGRAKIVDFGLALVTQGGTAVAEEIWATPFYVSPETLHLKEEDQRSDIYSLGATLYHAVSGVELFTTESRSTSEFIKLKTTIPKLGKVATGVNQYLCDVVDKMMAYAAEDRYQSYGELLSDLRKVDRFQRTGNEAVFTDESLSNGGGKAMLIGGALCAGFVISAAVAWQYFSNEDQGVKAQAAAKESSLSSVESANQAGKKALFAAELRNAMNLFEKGNYEAAHEEYLRLSQDVNLGCETACWAGLQSAIAAWVLGDSDLAHTSLHLLNKRALKGSSEQSDVELKLIAAVESLLQHGKVDVTEFSESKDEVDIQIKLATALKEWERGNWNGATELFIGISDSSISSDQKSAVTYKVIADRYLYDVKLLKDYSEGAQLGSLSEVEASQKVLTNTVALIQTKGIAADKLELMETQLESLAKGFRKQAVLEREQEKQQRESKQRQWKGAKNKAQSAFTEHRYADVILALQASQPVNEEGVKWREKTLYISQTITGLFEVTQQALEGKSADFTVLRSDGERSYDKLLGANDKGLIVSIDGADSEVLLWHAVSAQTMIELHVKLKASSLEADEKLKRMEQLTIYAWRMGVADKAESWSKMLIAEVPEFAQRWESIQQKDL